MKPAWKILFACLFIPPGLFSQQDYVDSLFIQANRYYEGGQHAEAANTYNRILDQGFEHPDLYYNLGNAYYQLGWLGEAIWAYEKGLQLNPGDTDLGFNLQVTNARTVDRVEAPEVFFLLKWYGALKNRFSPTQWMSIISVIFFSTGIVFSVSRFILTNFRRLLGNFVVLGVVATIISGLVFADRYLEVSERKEAIVIVREGKVFSEPTEVSNLMFVVHSGTKAQIKSSRDPWFEIELMDGKRGWIRWSSVKPL
ncbi:MAG: tetratricopeptide repeat protein [Candidatus Neomarinimicrobiota bacterium]